MYGPIHGFTSTVGGIKNLLVSGYNWIVRSENKINNPTNQDNITDVVVNLTKNEATNFVENQDGLKNNLPKLDIIIDGAGHYFKDQIITLFSLFEILNSKGYFIIEELDFPDTRKDMNILNETPTLKNILSSIKSNIDFNTKYITYEQKKYFLDNFESIDIFKGTFNEIAFIKKR